MIWLLIACNSADVVAPAGDAPPLSTEPAWATVRPLDGVQRLFSGPFRCRIPDGTVVDFHQNGMARGEPAFRGSWRHAGAELTVEARQEGVDVVYAWTYRPFTHEGDWVLASPEGSFACRPGHEAEPGSVGWWVEVLDAGGDTAKAARALGADERVAFAVDGEVTEPASGLVLRHRPGAPARAVAQGLANGLQQPVTLSPQPEITAPLQLVVGAAR